MMDKLISLVEHATKKVRLVNSLTNTLLTKILPQEEAYALCWCDCYTGVVVTDPLNCGVLYSAKGRFRHITKSGCTGSYCWMCMSAC